VVEVAAGLTAWQARRATVHDAEHTARIQVAGWRATYAGIVPTEYLAGMDTPERVELWRTRLSAPDPYATFVAVDEQAAIGAYCTVGPLRTGKGTGEPDAGELMAIYADPTRLRGGAGRVVHDAGIDHLIQQGFTWAGLWVFTGNDNARAFYESCGWAPDGATHDDEIMGTVVPETRYARRLL
jgi:GNAT superfamily N-acetyltransferase